jgi:hypothetical protein
VKIRRFVGLMILAIPLLVGWALSVVGEKSDAGHIKGKSETQ